MSSGHAPPPGVRGPQPRSPAKGRLSIERVLRAVAGWSSRPTFCGAKERPFDDATIWGYVIRRSSLFDQPAAHRPGGVVDPGLHHERRRLRTAVREAAGPAFSETVTLRHRNPHPRAAYKSRERQLEPQQGAVRDCSGSSKIRPRRDTFDHAVRPGRRQLQRRLVARGLQLQPNRSQDPGRPLRRGVAARNAGFSEQRPYPI